MQQTTTKCIVAALALALVATIFVVPASAQKMQVQSIPTKLGIFTIAFESGTDTQNVFLSLHNQPVQGGAYGVTIYDNGQLVGGGNVQVPNGASTIHYPMSDHGDYDIFVCPESIGDSIAGDNCAMFVQNQ